MTLDKEIISKILFKKRLYPFLVFTSQLTVSQVLLKPDLCPWIILSKLLQQDDILTAAN